MNVTEKLRAVAQFADEVMSKDPEIFVTVFVKPVGLHIKARKMGRVKDFNKMFLWVDVDNFELEMFTKEIERMIEDVRK